MCHSDLPVVAPSRAPRCLVSVVLVVMALAPAAGAADIAAPDGWTIFEEGGSLVFRPDDLAAGEDARIIVLPGEPLKGDFRRWFDAKRAAAEKGQRVTSGGKVEASKSRAGIDLLKCDVVVHSNAEGFVCRRYLAANPPGRVELIALRTNGPALFTKYQPAFDEMSLKWRDARLGAMPPGAGEVAAQPAAPAQQQQQPQQSRQQQQQPPAGWVEKVKDTPPKPGFIRGTVTDMRGKPLKDGRITLYAYGVTLRGGERATSSITVKPDGTFEQRVPDGIYDITCEYEVDLHGTRIKVPLDAQDGQPSSEKFDSTNGIAKDYRLRAHGLRPGGDKANQYDYYGGAVGLHYEQHHFRRGVGAEGGVIADRNPNANFELTLTPVGPLLDGSTVPEQKLTFAANDLGDGFGQQARYYPNIPLGRWKASASMTMPNGAKKRLKLSNLTEDAKSDAIEFVTEPGKYRAFFLSE
jgi:hypothetical protein